MSLPSLYHDIVFSWYENMAEEQKLGSEKAGKWSLLAGQLTKGAQGLASCNVPPHHQMPESMTLLGGSIFSIDTLYI
jgi:hypothetical protein